MIACSAHLSLPNCKFILKASFLTSAHKPSTFILADQWYSYQVCDQVTKSPNGTSVVCKTHSDLKKETFKEKAWIVKEGVLNAVCQPSSSFFLRKEFQVVQWRHSEQAAIRSLHCYSTALCKSIKSRKQPNLSVLKYLEVFLPHLSWLFYRKLDMTVPCWKKKKKAYKFSPGIFQKANPNIRLKKLCSTVLVFWNVNWVIEMI